MTDTKKPWEYGRLALTANRRYLQNGNRPFFWLGDTAWLLFCRLTLDEAYVYLKNRRDKGYNVIQIDCMHALNRPNLSGEAPLLDGDFNRPDETGGYWSRVDTVLAIAEELGLYVALLPVWGSLVKDGHLNSDNVQTYARFLAHRYQTRPNLIWLMGGDVRGSDGTEVWEKLARTIKEICPHHLMGFHPFGRTSSSQWFHTAEWLDFNMFQSGHRRYDQMLLNQWDDSVPKEEWFGEDNWKYVARDHSLSPMKPTIDGEPSYEQVLQGLHDVTQGYWQAQDVRRYAYWAVFAGAFGHTYGDNAVMQFYKPDSGKGAFGVKQYWYDALHNPGAGQMAHLKKLMTDFDFTAGLPDDEALAAPQKEKYHRIAVFSGEDFALCYAYAGEAFALSAEKLRFAPRYAWWFDTVTGTYSFLKSFETLPQTLEFTPPRLPEGQSDWVLVLTKEDKFN